MKWNACLACDGDCCTKGHCDKTRLNTKRRNPLISCIGARQRGQAIPFFFSQGATIHPQGSYSPFRINSPPSQRFRFITAFPTHTAHATPDRHYLQGHRFDAARLVGIAYEMTLVALHPRRGIDALGAAAALEDHRTGGSWGTRSGVLCDGALKAMLATAPVLITDPNPLPPHASQPVP